MNRETLPYLLQINCNMDLGLLFLSSFSAAQEASLDQQQKYFA